MTAMRDRVEPVGQNSRYHNQVGLADWPFGQKKNKRNLLYRDRGETSCEL